MTILRNDHDFPTAPTSFLEEHAPQLAGGLVALVIFALLFFAFVR